MVDPALVARVHVAYGTINWAPDEKTVLVKRGLDRQEGDLVWVPLPAPAADPESSPAERRNSARADTCSKWTNFSGFCSSAGWTFCCGNPARKTHSANFRSSLII